MVMFNGKEQQEVSIGIMLLPEITQVHKPL